MVKAGAFFYAITVALIIGLFSSSIIFFAWYNRIEVESALDISRAQRNSNSGMAMLLAQPEQIPPGPSTELNLFEGVRDLVELSRKYWGAFEIGVSTGQAGNFNFSRSALIGANLHSDSKISLYLADQNKPLSLCGRTEINGICYLPKAGVKRAYIEGQSFVGSELITGEQRESNKQLPEINPEMISQNITFLQGNPSSGDSLISLEQFLEVDTIIQPFSGKTITLQEQGAVVLTGKILKGNIRIISQTSVFIGSGSEINDILVYAPEIIVEKDFSGNLQLFGKDSIVIGKGSRLLYPSVVGLIQQDGQRQGTITVEEQAQITGVVFAYREKTGRKLLKIGIDKEAIIKGQVWCNGAVDMKGSIYGSLACEKFLLNTPSSVYENHLLNATIDYSRLPEAFVGVNLINSSDTREVVKWLY